MTESPLSFALLGQWEVGLILGVILSLFLYRRWPDLGRGFRLGVKEFWRATLKVRDEVDGEAGEAGRSVGGIYGKPAFEALTPKNETGELYDPEAVRGKGRRRMRSLGLWMRTLLRRVKTWIGALGKLIGR